MTAQLEHVSILIGADLQYEIEQFLYQEARMLDERRFEEWIDLFSEDTHYWMPTRSVRYERELHLEHSSRNEAAHFDETKDQLQERVTRIRSGMAWAEEPPSRTRHLVTNVLIEPADEEDEILVLSNLMLYRGRLDRDVDIFVGSREDVLRRSDSEHGWLIARRRIVLEQTLVQAKNLSIFF
jgi:3-phenylpropionate/cinnamic acid dioxygenase small subunit